MTEAPDQPLHLKYRPSKFNEVLGQESIIESLLPIIKGKKAQAFLFNGGSGMGKTTVARICARRLGCKDTLEVDAATNTGVDEMRVLQERLLYKSFISEERAIIVDECHMLSHSAWNSLLKIVEEPPPHVFWFFCTTQVNKVPQTIQTRCIAYTFNPLTKEQLAKLVAQVTKQEGIEISDGVFDLVVREAHGSPRKALVNLQQCRGVPTDAQKAAEVLRTALESDPVIELCRFLLSGKGSWPKCMSIVERITAPPESVRYIVVNYMATVLKNAQSAQEAIHLIGVIGAFSNPYNQGEHLAPLLLSIGACFFAPGGPHDKANQKAGR